MNKYVVATFCCSASLAHGVIKVDFPVSRMFTESKQVCVGTVAEWNADVKLATVKIDVVQKGAFEHKTIRVQLSRPDSVATKVSTGLPVVMFLSGETDANSLAIVHVADTWLLANGIAGMTPPAWRSTQLYGGGGGYPGRTPGVVRLVQAFRDGRTVLDDVIDPEGFAGKAREVANVGAGPRFLVSADVNGDGKPDLVAGTAAGVRLFLWRQQGYADATAASGLDGVKATGCAVGDADGDGSVDLLLDGSLWLAKKGTFVQARTASGLGLTGEPWLAGAIHDINGDGKPEVVVLYSNGLVVSVENPGSSQSQCTAAKTNLWTGTETASAAVFSDQWGDDGELCAMVVREDGVFRYGVSFRSRHAGDLERLTGSTIASCEGLKARPIRAVAAAAWDSDGNRKADLLVLTEAGGVMLMNRGLGAFLVNNVTHGKVAGFQVDGQARKVSSGCLVAAGPSKPVKKWRQSLFVTFPDGRVFELE
jgi:hypothetical protein